jgi:hypothetical protein
MNLERRIAAQAASPDGNYHIVLWASYKNFQHWYDVEIDRWVDSKVQTTVRDYLDVDQAFDLYERCVKNYKLIENEGV